MKQTFDVPEIFDRERPEIQRRAAAWAVQRAFDEVVGAVFPKHDWDEIYRDGKLRINDEEFQIVEAAREGFRDSRPAAALGFAMLWAAFVVGFVLGALVW